MAGPNNAPTLQVRERCLHWLLLLLLPALVFANTLRNDYHLDDVYRVRNNETELEQLSPLGRHFVDPRTSATLPTLVAYRPMLPLTLSLNIAASDALGVDRLVGYHLGNIAIHILTVLIAYRLFRELLLYWNGSALDERASTRLALAGALAFAVHPVSGVPVNYICARDLLLMLLFLMAALVVYVRMRRVGGGAWRWPLACILLAASLVSKTNAVVAPILVLAFELTCGNAKLSSYKGWLRTVPFALCVGAFFLVTELFLDFSDTGQLLIDRDSLEYPLTELGVHVYYYLRNAFWPFFMRPLPRIAAVESALDPKTLLAAAVVLASIAYAWRMRRRSPVASFSISAYWVCFLPTSSVLPFRSFAADYRQYPSLAFLCLLIALAIHHGLRGRLRGVALGAAVLWFGSTAHWMNRHWLTEETFWKQSVDHGGTALAHMNYAVAVRDRDPELAEKHLLETLELYPNHVYGHINLGLLLISKGEQKRGLALLERAVAIRPDWGITRHWHALGLQQIQRPFAAADAAWKATELDPRNTDYRSRAVEYQYLAARQAQMEGRVPDSLPYLARLHGIAESYRDSLFLEGFAFQSGGDRQRAVERYESFLRLEPENPQGLFNLAFAYMNQARYEDAVEHFRRCLAAKPEYKEVHLHLATCYGGLGDEVRAREELARYRE